MCETVYNHEVTCLAVRITILEVQNSNLGFISHVNMENHRQKARHYLILVAQYIGPVLHAELLSFAEGQFEDR